MIAYCICQNDSIEEIVLNDKSLAFKRIEELSKVEWERDKFNLKLNFLIYTYEEYRKRVYWHLHRVNVYNS